MTLSLPLSLFSHAAASLCRCFRGRQLPPVRAFALVLASSACHPSCPLGSSLFCQVPRMPLALPAPPSLCADIPCTSLLLYHSFCQVRLHRLCVPSRFGSGPQTALHDFAPPHTSCIFHLQTAPCQVGPSPLAALYISIPPCLSRPQRTLLPFLFSLL